MSDERERTTSRATGSIFIAELPDSGRFLFVEVILDCPLCGVQRWQIAGHHLRMIRDLCIDAIDKHPELCGTEPKVTDLLAFKGRGNDPSTS